MTIISSIKNQLLLSMERRGQRAAHQELIKMNDSQLEGFGISPALLAEGIAAWPWTNQSAVKAASASVQQPSSSQAAMDGIKQVPGQMQVVPTAQKRSAIKKAISELNAYSDRELAELGVTRNGIEEAVRYGRQTVEGANQAERHVA